MTGVLSRDPPERGPRTAVASLMDDHKRRGRGERIVRDAGRRPVVLTFLKVFSKFKKPFNSLPVRPMEKTSEIRGLSDRVPSAGHGTGFA